MKLLVVLSLLASGSLAIHDYVLDSANNNFTAFKVKRNLRTYHTEPLSVLSRFTELTPLRNIKQIFSTNWRLIPR